MYKNHHQIYTHCSKLGVIIGQYWRGKGYWGRVCCITEKGMVILDPLPKLCARHKVPIHQLVTEGELVTPVAINPYKQVNGKVHFQVLAFEKDSKDLDYYPFGEIRRDYIV